jgi:hypothetical protein
MKADGLGGERGVVDDGLAAEEPSQMLEPKHDDLGGVRRLRCCWKPPGTVL